MPSSSSAAIVNDDDSFRPSPAMISGDLSASNNSMTQAFAFSSGNPRIEETRGVMHLFNNDIDDGSGVLSASSSNHKLPVSSLIMFSKRMIGF